MTQQFQSVKGAKDLLPTDTVQWQHLEALLRRTMHLFGYSEIRTPIFEETPLFARSIGAETDIVGKEMYTFTDKGGTSLTLRPEMTASVVRAFNQHHLGEQASITKLYYIGPMFRQERPQAGRLRQFHQFGIECIGQSNPVCDAEIILLAAQIYRQLGIAFELRLNSVGDEHCRPVYKEALKKYLLGISNQLSAESQRRIDANILRVLDSKDERDIAATADAPKITEYLCDDCAQHFESVKTYLRDLAIPFTIDHQLVRGLDYYTKTAFEFVSSDLGAQDALGGGGRYDRLIDALGGKPTPAVGFAAGIERLLIVLHKKNYIFPEATVSTFIIGLDEDARRLAVKLAMQLRSAGHSVGFDYSARSMKAQMREANKLNVEHVVIIGRDEMEKNTVVVKRMSSGEQEHVGIPNLLLYFDSRPDNHD